MNATVTLAYVYIIAIVLADINDIIRGSWFFPSLGSLVLWNLMGIIAGTIIVYDKLERGLI